MIAADGTSIITPSLTSTGRIPVVVAISSTIVPSRARTSSSSSRVDTIGSMTRSSAVPAASTRARS